jgi:hypothetical protein
MKQRIVILTLALFLLTSCGTVQRFILKTADDSYHRKAAQLVVVDLDEARMEAQDRAAADSAPKYQAAQAKLKREGGCDLTCLMEVRQVEKDIGELQATLVAENKAFSEVHLKLGLISERWGEEPSETEIHLFDDLLAEAKKPLTTMMVLAGTVNTEKGRRALRARL